MSRENSNVLHRKISSNDKLEQMSRQQELIEQKKLEIQMKLAEKKRKETEEALKKIQPTATSIAKKAQLNTQLMNARNRWSFPKNRFAGPPRVVENSSMSGPTNIFSNDGSFLEQFKKISGMSEDKNNDGADSEIKELDSGADNSSAVEGRKCNDTGLSDLIRQQTSSSFVYQSGGFTGSSNQPKFTSSSVPPPIFTQPPPGFPPPTTQLPPPNLTAFPPPPALKPPTLMTNFVPPGLNKGVGGPNFGSQFPPPHLASGFPPTNVPPPPPLPPGVFFPPTAVIPPPAPLNPHSIPAPSPLTPHSIPAPSPLTPHSIPAPSPLTPHSIPAPSPLQPSSIPPPQPILPHAIPPPPRGFPLPPPIPPPPRSKENKTPANSIADDSSLLAATIPVPAEQMTDDDLNPKQRRSQLMSRSLPDASTLPDSSHDQLISRSPNSRRDQQNSRSPDSSCDQLISRSPDSSRDQLISRSPDSGRDQRNYSRSPDSSRDQRNSRSPDSSRDELVSRSRDSSRDQLHSRSRDSSRDRLNSRSRDSSRDQLHSRSRDSSRDQLHSRSRDSSRDQLHSRSRDSSRDQLHSRSRDSSRDRLNSRSLESNRNQPISRSLSSSSSSSDDDRRRQGRRVSRRPGSRGRSRRSPDDDSSREEESDDERSRSRSRRRREEDSEREDSVSRDGKRFKVEEEEEEEEKREDVGKRDVKEQPHADYDSFKTEPKLEVKEESMSDWDGVPMPVEMHQRPMDNLPQFPPFLFPDETKDAPPPPPPPAPETGRKRRSRWGEPAAATPLDGGADMLASIPPPPTPPQMPPVGMVIPTGLGNIPAPSVPTINVPGMKGAMISQVSRTDPALLQYAMQNFGSTQLSEEDWKKAEDHFKINLLYQDMMRKREEVQRLEAAGKHRYEYDSDEEVEGGTWEHRLREKEMEATQLWAEQLTRAATGKHHIGDFLPPEELAQFMEKYEALKQGRPPDLSDYKEYKLKEDNVGFQMLQKLGWTEGQGLGSEGTGILNPVNKATSRGENQGLGLERPDDVSVDDDEYDAYRKRMMLAYRFRPNPLNNPRRPYY